MSNIETIIRTASFNPKVKTYIFLVVVFFLIVSVIGLVVLPFWLLGLGQWLSKKYYHTLSCTLSDKNLRFSKGVIVHIEKTIPLENIQDLSFIGGPILRSFSLVIIKVETAGGGGPHTGNAMSILGIDHADLMKNAILEQREIRLQKRYNHQDNSNSVNTSSNKLLTEIKNELTALKEFIMQKS